MKLVSSAFEPGATIPPRFTCEGRDVSPPLRIEGVPAGARSLALLVDDPDAPAGLWDHWVVWNLRPDVGELPAGWGNRAHPDEAVDGTNSWGTVGWRGPCPPFGTHRYVFHLYALDGEVDLPAGASGDALRKAIPGHVLDEVELIGRFRRSPVASGS